MNPKQFRKVCEAFNRLVEGGQDYKFSASISEEYSSSDDKRFVRFVSKDDYEQLLPFMDVIITTQYFFNTNLFEIDDSPLRYKAFVSGVIYHESDNDSDLSCYELRFKDKTDFVVQTNTLIQVLDYFQRKGGVFIDGSTV